MADTRQTELSRCGCGDNDVSIGYTEEACSYISGDLSSREDGHDLQSYELDFENVVCRGCGEPRTLTPEDIALIEES